MGIVLGFNFLIYGGLLIIALLSWFIWDKRYRRNHGREIPNCYVVTDEVFIDPVSGKKLRVYYNPQSGNRYYHED
ncbi:hypothetical protein [Desulfosporosinus sp. FKA]|uniref:hypothetical protein n=1 Tax=Desulfosporosinus sp. FKA TaxID=1969834 RepID=UPI000B49D5C6|nr:hypothetical protein [Desulfosporosinus sp. FKA]